MASAPYNDVFGIMKAKPFYAQEISVGFAVTVHRFRVQRSGLRTKKALKTRSPH
jgi:hypothetical protein